jgi:drug/metabolite transporter (DMT)-like permease
VPVLFGLLASVCIGTSDFLGARSAGRTTALQATTAAFLGGAVLVLIYSPFLGHPSVRDLGFGAASGIAAFVALTTLWRAYARSSIGLAAPIAAVVSTVLPVLFDAARGTVPGPFGWSGMVVGSIAIVLTSWVPGAVGRRDGIVLGAAAGVAFAAMFLLAVETSEGAGTWPVVSQRFVAFGLAALVTLGTRRRLVGDIGSTVWSVLAGAVGATGVASVVYGGQRGPIAPVVVAGSMYPAVAVTLAWMFMRQGLQRRQVLGIAAACVGVALIALD